jgi:hypothetical protein
MLLDSGTDPSAIDLAPGRRLALDLDVRSKSAHTTGPGYAGQSHYEPVKIDSIKMGEISFGAQEAFALVSGNRIALEETEAEANVGNGLLQSCVLTLDYRNHSITVRSCAKTD